LRKITSFTTILPLVVLQKTIFKVAGKSPIPPFCGAASERNDVMCDQRILGDKVILGQKGTVLLTVPAS
jgi:hypothetical protein